MGKTNQAKRNLVIVESPAKARTIERYLGEDYLVRASKGHVRDLPERALGVDIKHGFRPTYRIIRGKEAVVAQLKKDAAQAKAIYLAADPDREGEAICFHLAELLTGNGSSEVYRVLCNEITRDAIREAFAHPTAIDQNKVDAQQARRILDRLVGYKISPLLWQKVRKGLSAGRVQTVAVRLIVDREREIRAFVPEEYWEFRARLEGSRPPAFVAKAVRRNGKKFEVGNREEADALFEELQRTEFVVSSVTRKERKRNPLPPFTTSQLQQEAVRKLGFTVRKTMEVAQRLYEGVELGPEGRVGLITYMRTDSTRVADSALQEVREFIGEKFGKDYLPARPKKYASKAQAQDAHEAIRPTSVLRDPETVKPFLDRDEFRLYTLIWNRFVASQMTSARYDQTEILISAGSTQFKAVGSILKFDGFLKVWKNEGKATEEGETDALEAVEGTLLPDLEEGEVLKVHEIQREQKFTQPPPRYNEASLVKALEERGIGRPSTYQQILAVIQRRDYVRKEQGRFVPTELAEIVNDLLVEHFGSLFDYDYTAKLEEELDRVEEGRLSWLETLERFYRDFRERLEAARLRMQNFRKEVEETDQLCEKCGGKMVIRLGRFGRFLACSNFPRCRNSRELGREAGEQEAGGRCPECDSVLVRRAGRYGEFIACSRYPACRFARPLSTGVRCPQCGRGDLVQRRSKRGRFFYGCERYPECNFLVWQKPIPQPCPRCGSPYLLERTTKQTGAVWRCPEQGCGFSMSADQKGRESVTGEVGGEGVALSSETGSPE